MRQSVSIPSKGQGKVQQTAQTHSSEVELLQPDTLLCVGKHWHGASSRVECHITAGGVGNGHAVTQIHKLGLS